MRPKLLSALFPLVLIACSGADESTSTTGTQPGKTDDEYAADAVQGMHDALLADIQAMSAAGAAMTAAAPVPSDRGWDAKLDADAIAAMRASWVEARTAYEHVEGALAPLFPNVDMAIDARYDDFMTDLASSGGDPNLFDGKGVTGMHAIERIVYADVTPARVVEFEASLPGYVPAAFPSTAAEASALRDGLLTQFVADTKTLEELWTPTNIHAAIAFQGLISLVTEQREKVVKAASSEEESRYSQRTMADLRDNLVGTKAIYALFRPWIVSKTSSDPQKDGPTIDANIQKGFATLDATYEVVKGDAIPEPPATWSAENPSAADLATPFGELYSSVQSAVDPAKPDSVVAQMNDAAELLAFPSIGDQP
jgi:iron uptake system component EfeO